VAIGTPTDIGGATGSAVNAATVALTTTVTVPANSLIVICSGAGNEGTGAPTCAGGSLTWQLDADQAIANKTVIFSAYAASGLASGTTITVTWAAAGTNPRTICGLYITGILSAAWKDVSATFTSGATAQAAWDTGTTGTTAQASEIAIGAARAGVATTSSVTTGGAVELHDFQGGASTLTTAYLVLSATGTARIQGNFALATGVTRGAIATYKAAADVVTPPGLIVIQQAVNRASTY
jgi:hypothetical protein